MSQVAFQSALGRLATDRAFRDRARAEGALVFGPGFTPLERRRLAGLGHDRGLDLTAALIASFRLGKLLSLLPLTRGLLGPRRFAREARRFWAAHPPVSFYLPDEATGFCEHLLARLREGWRVPYLAEVVAYERAMIELRRVRPAGRQPAPQRLAFRHDPGRLLTALARGRRPRRIPRRPCVVVGRAKNGDVEWVVEQAPARAPAG